MDSGILNAQLNNNEEEIKQLVKSLRPKTLNEMIGREKEKANLRVVIQAAKQREEALDHILLHGPPGLGKTSLAQVIANEIKAPLYATSGPAIERKGDLASILTNIEPLGVLFIDEIHRLNRTIEEMLYAAMEDRVIDIIIGKGPSARTLKLELNHFTIIGATTRVSLLSSPLRDRFGIDIYLDYYNHDELTDLVKQKAALLNILIDQDAAREIALRSRRTPRIAIRILKRVRDLAQVNLAKRITKNLALEALKMLEIDHFGLDNLDRKIILTLIKHFKGGPVGLNTLAAAVSEDLDTISDVYEPFLLKEGFINRTARGRVATEKALRYYSEIS
ncbi:MAG TPA: Holliday junction branch migration DNA helicase RuvB [Candidatus Dojkabacteria bacterium]|nr:Holliday junction branch migration DNA helicase RuvB [Candidatus Dojkabacteria bacterium]